MKNNQVILIGYVGSPVSSTISASGNRRVSIRMATHYAETSPDGQKRWHTVWHNVVAWDHIAEFAAGNFVKGSRILVDGALDYRTFPDRTGHIRYMTQIKASRLINLDR